MTDKQKVVKSIERAADTKELDLSGRGLTSFPMEVMTLTALTSLSLNNNMLTDIPPEIAGLDNLERLDLSHNDLTQLPPEIGKLRQLKYFFLNVNRLESLPAEITNLSNLIHLDLSENKLTELPLEIGKLRELEYLFLTLNRLTALPDGISHLSKLKYLSLGENLFSSLPAELGELHSLRNLLLYSNRLTILPPEINQLTKLFQLDLRKNQLPISPEALEVPTNVKAIFAALDGLVSGEKLNEAKMLVLGDGKVGKSSVVARLVYDTYDPQRETTLGVEINDEMKVIQSEVHHAGEEIKLNIWDFGGQEIQHSTHQFFLTTRSLYLLVVDARKGDQINNIEYWLKLIESFGGDSPIIIVANQIDQLSGQRALNLDRRALQAKYNIRAFVETSCPTGDGIASLKSMVIREVEQMKHVRDVWPREWLAIKRRLRSMQDDYIPVEQYLQICNEERLYDSDLQQSLLALLHDLGTVICFPGETQVLNPRWVTQGVYGLLTSTLLVESQGQFDFADMGKILGHSLPDAEIRYPAHTHRRLIDVMRHFQLCFEFTDRRGHYLIPRHLHDNEPEIPWDDSDALKFQYQYVETLPDSVISRFIVRMNQYIHRQYYWKNGVFLHDGDNRARIKADLVDRKIFISVVGKEQTRRAFLAVIRSAFDEINSNFKIEIHQMIPLPGFPEELVSYKDLLDLEHMEENEIIVPKLRKRFSVTELLDGVEDSITRIERRERDLADKGLVSVPRKVVAQASVKVLRVVLASPSDVQTERDVLPSIIDEVNRVFGPEVRLELSRWETDIYPGFHPEGPQGLIDPVLRISDCDVLIGIFWKRFGTITSDGRTGTEHEFDLAYQAWVSTGKPQIFVYFNLKPYTPKSKAETDNWGSVIEFRDKFPKEGLWWPYNGEAEFERLVRIHLMNYIKVHLKP